MSCSVVLTAEAEADLDEAASWYEERSEGLGVEFMMAVRATMSFVSQNPTLYAILHADLRRAPVARFPYGVLYRFHDDRVTVVAVLHGRRNPSAWIRRAREV